MLYNLSLLIQKDEYYLYLKKLFFWFFYSKNPEKYVSVSNYNYTDNSKKCFLSSKLS